MTLWCPVRRAYGHVPATQGMNGSQALGDFTVACDFIEGQSSGIQVHNIESIGVYAKYWVSLGLPWCALAEIQLGIGESRRVF